MLALYIFSVLIQIFLSEQELLDHVVYYDDDNNFEINLNITEYTEADIFAFDAYDRQILDFHLRYRRGFKSDVVIQYRSKLPEMAFPRLDALMFLNMADDFKNRLRIKRNKCHSFDRLCSVPINFVKISPDDIRFEKYLKEFQDNGPLVSVGLFRIQNTSNTFLNIQIDTDRMNEICGSKAQYYIPNKDVQQINIRDAVYIKSTDNLNQEQNYYMPNKETFAPAVFYIVNPEIVRVYGLWYKYLGPVEYLQLNKIPKICHVIEEAIEVPFESSFKTNLLGELFVDETSLTKGSLKYLRKEVTKKTVKHIYMFSATTYNVGSKPMKLRVTHKLFPKVNLLDMDIVTCKSDLFLKDNAEHIELRKKIQKDLTVFKISGMKDAKFIKLSFNWASTTSKNSLICEAGRLCEYGSNIQCFYGAGDVSCNISQKSKSTYLQVEIGMHPDFTIPIPSKFKLFEEYPIVSYDFNIIAKSIVDNSRLLYGNSSSVSKKINITFSQETQGQNLQLHFDCSISNNCNLFEIVSGQFKPINQFEIVMDEPSLYFNRFELKFQRKARGNFKDNGFTVDVREFHNLENPEKEFNNWRKNFPKVSFKQIM